MTQNHPVIEHPAIVVKINESDYDVMIMAQSACASCHAKGACSAADMEQKIVKVPKLQKDTFQTGEKVTVFMKQQAGGWAVFFGYILPFLIMVSTLIILISCKLSEGLAGLAALFILIPYYLVLYLNKKKLDSRFEFALKEKQEDHFS